MYFDYQLKEFHKMSLSMSLPSTLINNHNFIHKMALEPNLKAQEATLPSLDEIPKTLIVKLERFVLVDRPFF